MPRDPSPTINMWKCHTNNKLFEVKKNQTEFLKMEVIEIKAHKIHCRVVSTQIRKELVVWKNRQFSIGSAESAGDREWQKLGGMGDMTRNSDVYHLLGTPQEER